MAYLKTMKLLKNTTWKEVFEGWKQREANDPDWINCATKVMGWQDWESWRKFTVSQLDLNNLSWQIFEFTNPISEIPSILMGPYHGWQSRVKEKNVHTFEELIDMPEQFQFFSNHDKVTSMMNNFPSPTEFIGLIREDNGKIVCVEGHHRATAIALAKKQNIDVRLGKTTIALAKFNQIDLLDKALKRKTTKNKEAKI